MTPFFNSLYFGPAKGTLEVVHHAGVGRHAGADDELAIDQRRAAALGGLAHVHELGVEVERHGGLGLIGVPHASLQDLLLVAQEVVPVQRNGEDALDAQLVYGDDGRGDLAVGGEDDELVVAGHGRALDDVFDHHDVGLVAQRDVGGHAPVMGRMRAVHRAGQQHHARLLRQLLGQTDGVEIVRAARAVRAVLFNRAERQNGDVILLWRGRALLWQ